MASAIPGSLLLHLHDLPSQPHGSKVRFLGCVRDYDPVSATLTLTHPPKVTPCAEVDISVPLPTLAKGSLRNGNWVNVIGYMVHGEEGVARVDAIDIWSADGVQPSKYSRLLKQLQATEREMDELMNKTHDVRDA